MGIGGGGRLSKEECIEYILHDNTLTDEQKAILVQNAIDDYDKADKHTTNEAVFEEWD